MPCLCRCGRVIDCGDTKCVLCEEADAAAASGFHVLDNKNDLPRSGLGIEEDDENKLPFCNPT